MDITEYHVRYFAHELTKRCPSNSVEKLTSVLANAQVDLNPHQIEAALFAFQNPFSKGAILADEVGLGKTIEAGLLISQKWAEKKRKILIILPANLRKQWSQELADKFFLPTIILETKSFNEIIKKGNLNPFNQKVIILCSYQFARSKDIYIQQVPWDLIVLDEAHRLRNVYKPSSKIANAIKKAIEPYPKVLLTATPLQNSLLELYGLVSVIDDYSFGDFKSYKTKYSRLGEGTYEELRERLKPLCKRTLRRQVMEYIKYTNRHAIVQEFIPSNDEQLLYDLVSDYLQKPNLYALPASQRQLITLILRKLLASSTYAISGTLDGLAKRLEAAARASEEVENPPPDLPEDWEELEELAEEWEEEDDEEDGDNARDPSRLTPEQINEMKSEISELREFHKLAKSIIKNSKGEVLLQALRNGFSAAEKAQREQNTEILQKKAVIFTESRRTQAYLFQVLENTEFSGKVMVFNGTNTDPQSREIYQKWLERNKGTDKISGSATADKRAALVDYFREEASILIATEAAAEGINLQFCNLVVNYDLPWNPQRIEQRIGRCHRYGQKFDVVVVNFLNKKNAADLRVYQLLAEKFSLFDGVFGASDDVLGAVESGVDFEKRIATIYQKCRTKEQIQFEFDQLQSDLEEKIAAGQHEAREKLLNNFDQEVIEKVRLDSADYLDIFNQHLWWLTHFLLKDYANFSEDEFSFYLHTNPFPKETINPGPYRMGRAVDDANTYRVGHPLAERLLEKGKNLSTPSCELTFDYTKSGKHISVLEHLVGKQGWLVCSRITLQAVETEDVILILGLADDGEVIDPVEARRIFELKAITGLSQDISQEMKNALQKSQDEYQKKLLVEQAERNSKFLDLEMDKLDRWAEDRRISLKTEVDDLEEQIKTTRREARQAYNLPEKVEKQQLSRKLSAKRDEALKEYYAAAKELDGKKEDLLDEVTARMEQKIEREELFSIRWMLK
jgi:hypothetical protein